MADETNPHELCLDSMEQLYQQRDEARAQVAALREERDVAVKAKEDQLDVNLRLGREIFDLTCDVQRLTEALQTARALCDIKPDWSDRNADQNARIAGAIQLADQIRAALRTAGKGK